MYADRLSYAEYRMLRESDASEHSPGDYLVHGDKPSDYHLPVKRHGTPDHRLMAAARAALTSNYRGNPYQGPDKGGALAALKALYKSEGMQWSDSEE